LPWICRISWSKVKICLHVLREGWIFRTYYYGEILCFRTLSIVLVIKTTVKNSKKKKTVGIMGHWWYVNWWGKT
jgi:hypothetical protein